MSQHQTDSQNQPLLDLMLSCSSKETWDENRRLYAASLRNFENLGWLAHVEYAFVIGHGTSYATACNAETFLSNIGGLSARAIPAFEFHEYMKDYMKVPKKSLVVGISCGGNTKSVVRALRAAREYGAITVCLSGEGNIQCASVAEYRIITDCGIEKRGPTSHPYSVSHLFLLQAAYELSILIGVKSAYITAEESNKWSELLNETLNSLKILPNLFNRMGEVVDYMRNIGTQNHIVLGSGPNRGTMIEGALKISEFAWHLGAGEEIEDFGHGRFRELDQKTPLLILAPSGPTVDKTMDILAGCQVADCKSVVFSDVSSTAMKKLSTFVVEMPKLNSEYLTPFVYIFPLWFYGFHMKDSIGLLVGQARYGLYAVDIDFKAHHDEMGNRI